MDTLNTLQIQPLPLFQRNFWNRALLVQHTNWTGTKKKKNIAYCSSLKKKKLYQKHLHTKCIKTTQKKKYNFTPTVPWKQHASKPKEHFYKINLSPAFLRINEYDYSSLIGSVGSNPKIRLYIYYIGFPGGSEGKESASNAGDLGSIPWWGRLPGEGNGYPL